MPKNEHKTINVAGPMPHAISNMRPWVALRGKESLYYAWTFRNRKWTGFFLKKNSKIDANFPSAYIYE